MNLLKCPCI